MNLNNEALDIATERIGRDIRDLADELADLKEHCSEAEAEHLDDAWAALLVVMDPINALRKEFGSDPV